MLEEMDLPPFVIYHFHNAAERQAKAVNCTLEGCDRVAMP